VANNARRSRGRPVGRSGLKDRIVQVAAERFRAHGYAGTSLRSIAREAAVDPALLNYHFRSKHGLFVAAMEFGLDPAHVLDEVIDQPASTVQLARELLERAMTAWESPGQTAESITALQSSLGHEQGRRALREFLEGEILGQIARRIGGASARQQAAPAAVVMSGLILSRYFLQLEPLASMPRRQVVELLTPVLVPALHRVRGAPRAR
jgi:AcrR family transcriptional regulator